MIVFVFFVVCVGKLLFINIHGKQNNFGAKSDFRAKELIRDHPYSTGFGINEHPTSNITLHLNSYLHSSVIENDKMFQQWLGNETALCDNRFIGYNNVFALLRNVILDPSKGQGRKGGEYINDVINQAEDEEFFKLKKGYFSACCKGKLQYSFRAYLGKDHLSVWLNATDTITNTIAKQAASRWTIAVMRYEYANLFFTMEDYYNAFLIMAKFNLDPEETDILFVDGHPSNALDSTWETLFGNVIRAGRLNESILYPNLIWNIMGFNSPLQEQYPTIPLLEQFRQFFLTRHGIYRDKVLNCDKLTVLFLWRRDYLAHPRNPSGKVSRKVKNEDELISAVTELLPAHDVRGVQMDKYSMKMQLQFISETDILIGMHGAGLTHTLFLPPRAGLIEFYPNYLSKHDSHYRDIAHWRNLHYAVWQNTEGKRILANKYTLVDEKAVVKMVHEIYIKLCGKQAKAQNIQSPVNFQNL